MIAMEDKPMQIMLLIGYADEALAQNLSRFLMREDDITSRTTALANVVTSTAAMRPDVLLLEGDADGGLGSALRHLSNIRRVSPETRSLLLHESAILDLTIEAIKQGASGCLNKSSDPSLFAKAIRVIHAGETWFGRAALLQALQSKICAPAAPLSLRTEGLLTPREEEILRFTGSGLTNKEIGRRLEISDKTVKTHLHHIYVKLNKSGRYKALLSQPGKRLGPLREPWALP